MDVYIGLLASMCCVGACYSARLSPDQVREVTNFLKAALERDTNLLTGGLHAKSTAAIDKVQLEKLQSLMLLIILLTWNGTPAQREDGRRFFPYVAEAARQLELLRVSSGPYLRSVLHQPDFSLQNVRPEYDFDWVTWVEQERRIRLMHMIYLMDVTEGLYFNAAPQFDGLELHIPLPADDAAWEAHTPTECAEALHLYGSDAAKTRNPDGSQRSKQPELDLALRALFHESYQIHPGSTNLYGKFILIHGLLAQIRRAHAEGNLATLSGFSTPLSHNDWVFKPGSEPPSAAGSANNSGRATPVSGLSQGISPQAYKSICTALDKFKSNWDMDMAIQFPPSVQNHRRYGFSRDGIHYFWLAKYIVKNTRPGDLHLPGDHRFMQVIQLIKSVKAWVMSDGAQRGEELGSMGQIDNDFGSHDLTLNMPSLFKPLPEVVDAPGMAVVKTEM